ncbi:MAG: hypothetical protein ACTS6A_02615, partial [Candidatus Hodgkinia cicadicola]
MLIASPRPERWSGTWSFNDGNASLAELCGGYFSLLATPDVILYTRREAWQSFRRILHLDGRRSSREERDTKTKATSAVLSA